MLIGIVVNRLDQNRAANDPHILLSFALLTFLRANIGKEVLAKYFMWSV